MVSICKPDLEKKNLRDACARSSKGIIKKSFSSFSVLIEAVKEVFQQEKWVFTFEMNTSLSSATLKKYIINKLFRKISIYRIDSNT